MVAKFLDDNKKEFNQRQWWRQRVNGKKAIGLDWQNNNFALFVHFHAVVARLRPETF